MRKIDSETANILFLIGPMYYNIFRFIKINKNYMLRQNITLYRIIKINKYDLNLYYMAQGHIICFPSFTSTSFLKYDFMTTVNALKVNNPEKDNVVLTMIFKYIHDPNNEIPFAMILKDYSKLKEYEVLFLPFTFVKVDQLKKIDDISYELECEINSDILENSKFLMKNY